MDEVSPGMGSHTLVEPHYPRCLSLSSFSSLTVRPSDLSQCFFIVTDLLEEQWFQLPFWIPSHLWPGFCSIAWHPDGAHKHGALLASASGLDLDASYGFPSLLYNSSKNLQLQYGKPWLLQSECYYLRRWHALTTVVSCSTCVYVASARNFTWRMENLLFYLDYHMNGREDHKESKSSEAFIKWKSVLLGTPIPVSLQCYRIFIAFLTILDSNLPAEKIQISNFTLPWWRSDKWRAKLPSKLLLLNSVGTWNKFHS